MLRAAIEAAVQEVYSQQVAVVLTRPDAQHGDYATNVAMQLAKPIGKNPRVIAEALAEKLRDNEALARVDVAGPGFLNLTLTDAFLIDELSRQALAKRTDQKIVIETNNPNPFKAMHIGHAFNAILADTIANLLEADGAETHRVSYHGDVGTHVGKSMWALLDFIDGDINKLHAIPEAERNSFMSEMYAKGATAAREDEAVAKRVDELAKQSFTLDDPLYRQVYELCKAWSFDGIDSLVARLGNQPIEKRYLESEADSLGVQTVQAHVGTVFVESNGALIFEGSKFGSFDNAFVKSNGQGLYGARDLGLMQLKHNDYHADKSYIVTAEEQRDYFKGVIAAAEQCLRELKDVTENISTGTVVLTTGKMSSRTGDVIEVDWLLTQIADAIRARGGVQDAAIEAGALRYQFLKVRIGSDVVFDINEAVSVVGNSGPYLQYAHARARSILAKSTATTTVPVSLDDDERLLVRSLSQYNEVVERAAEELLPHHICTYLYELSQQFNRFYEHNRVISDERESVRLALVEHYADTLKDGLRLLGIHAPDKM